MNSKYFKLFLFILVASLSACSSVSVVNIKDAGDVEIKDNGVIYALPRTVIRVEVEATKVEIKAGEFAEYAGKYLGLTDVYLKDSSRWYISNINITEFSEPDADNYYYVESSKSHCPILINLTEQGIISTINTNSPYEEDTPPAYFIGNNTFHSDTKTSIVMDGQMEKTDTSYRTIRTDSTSRRVPVYRKRLVNKSLEDKAKEIAKNILELREEKMSLMIGDVEEFPDGIATTKIIDEFNKIEKEYLPLFTGTQTSKTFKTVFEITPDNNSNYNNIVLFNFSPDNGISKTSDAEMNKVSIVFNNIQNTQFLDSFNVHKDTLVTKDKGLFYRIPEKVNVNIVYNNDVIASKTITIAQFGKLNILPSKYIQNRHVAIEFYPETGALKSIFRK